MNQQTAPPAQVPSGSMSEILQLIDELEKRFRQFQVYTLKEARLTIPQYYILSLLSEKDGRPFKELAKALACSRATVTGIVDTLEKKELVTRAANPGDRRSLLVRLTGKGRALLQSTPALESAYGTCCEVLPPEEGRELSRLLRKLSDLLPF